MRKRKLSHEVSDVQCLSPTSSGTRYRDGDLAFLREITKNLAKRLTDLEAKNVNSNKKEDTEANSNMFEENPRRQITRKKHEKSGISNIAPNAVKAMENALKHVRRMYDAASSSTVNDSSEFDWDFEYCKLRMVCMEKSHLLSDEGQQLLKNFLPKKEMMKSRLKTPKERRSRSSSSSSSSSSTSLSSFDDSDLLKEKKKGKSLLNGKSVAKGNLSQKVLSAEKKFSSSAKKCQRRTSEAMPSSKSSNHASSIHGSHLKRTSQKDWRCDNSGNKSRSNDTDCAKRNKKTQDERSPEHSTKSDEEALEKKRHRSTRRYNQKVSNREKKLDQDTIRVKSKDCNDKKNAHSEEKKKGATKNSRSEPISYQTSRKTKDPTPGASQSKNGICGCDKENPTEQCQRCNLLELRSSSDFHFPLSMDKTGPVTVMIEGKHEITESAAKYFRKKIKDRILLARVLPLSAASPTEKKRDAALTALRSIEKATVTSLSDSRAEVRLKLFMEFRPDYVNGSRIRNLSWKINQVRYCT